MTDNQNHPNMISSSPYLGNAYVTVDPNTQIAPQMVHYPYVQQQYLQQPLMQFAPPPQQQTFPMQAVYIQQPPTAPSNKNFLGSFGSFLKGLLLSMFFPLISLLVVFAMDTPSLTRLGSVLGNANIFLWLAFYMLSLGAFDDYFERPYYCDYHNNNYNNNYNYNYNYTNNYNYNQPNYNDPSCSSSSPLYFISIPFFILAMATFIFAGRMMFNYMKAFKQTNVERSHLPSDSVGSNSGFVAGLIVSFILPIFGSALMLMVNRQLKSRYGVMMGLALFFFVFGIASVPFWFLSFVSGNPCLLIGMVLMECTILHFQRLIATINIASKPTIVG